MDQEYPKEETERRARAIAQRMLTRPPQPRSSQKREEESSREAAGKAAIEKKHD